MGLQKSFINALRDTYRARVEAMQQSLSEHLSEYAHWQRPDGGYFFWLELRQSLDTKELRKNAFDHGIGFQPGAVFSSIGNYKNFLRLSFAHYTCEEIHQAIPRLAALVQSSHKK
jgi:DNA-binding transcriptional MocR family regulator